MYEVHVGADGLAHDAHALDGGRHRGLEQCLARGWSTSACGRHKSDPVSLVMRLELAEHLIEKRGFADEWKRSRR